MTVRSDDGMADVLIVGVGHNGLTCAAYLQRAGRAVTVVEANAHVGGFAATVDHQGAPGFRGTVAFDHVLTNIAPSVIDELALARHGDRTVAPDPHYSWLRKDGASIAFYRDQRRTVEEIRRYSRTDAERYGELMDAFTELWWTIIPYLQDHPTRPSGRTVAKTLSRAARRRKSLSAAARVMLSSPGAVIEEWFESPELRAALANFAVGSMAPLDEPSSGFVLSLLALMHRWGVRRSVGGSGAFSDALAAEVHAQGGQIRTRARVERILFSGRRARGVRLVDGAELFSEHIVAAVDPHTLLNELVGDDMLTQRLRSEMRGMGVLGNNVSAFKGDIAFGVRPHLARHSPQDSLLGSCMMFSPSIDDVRRSTTVIARGELPVDTPMWLSVTSVLDRTLVPEGSSADAAYLYLPAVPFDFADGADWAGVKDKVLERALGTFENFAPGVTDQVISATATSPHDLIDISAVHRGNFMHVDQTMAQFGPWRPTPTLSGYQTPWEGLWHTGAGAHPCGLMNGWSGRSTAKRILKVMS
jgi:beta-carotene ketolase (CrtO type)